MLPIVVSLPATANRVPSTASASPLVKLHAWFLQKWCGHCQRPPEISDQDSSSNNSGSGRVGEKEMREVLLHLLFMFTPLALIRMLNEWQL